MVNNYLVQKTPITYSCNVLGNWCRMDSQHFSSSVCGRSGNPKCAVAMDSGGRGGNIPRMGTKYLKFSDFIPQSNAWNFQKLSTREVPGPPKTVYMCTSLPWRQIRISSYMLDSRCTESRFFGNGMHIACMIETCTCRTTLVWLWACCYNLPALLVWLSTSSWTGKSNLSP